MSSPLFKYKRILTGIMLQCQYLFRREKAVFINFRNKGGDDMARECPKCKGDGYVPK
jgi:hypothetical protein